MDINYCSSGNIELRLCSPVERITELRSMTIMLNIGYVPNETNTDVRMYIEEFILVEIWIHCCTNWN